MQCNANDFFFFKIYFLLIIITFTMTTSSIPHPSLQTFLKIPIDCIVGEVNKVNHTLFSKTTYNVHLMIHCPELKISIDVIVPKRYTEFQGFYDTLTLRYQNINFPEFPSKLQLINKEEKRKKFFDSLVKLAIQLVTMHPKIKNDLMKIIYEFTIGCKDVEITELVSSEAPKLRESIQCGTHNKLSAITEANESSASISIDERILKAPSQERATPPQINDTNLITSLFQSTDGIQKEKTIDGWLVDIKYSKDKFSKAYVKIIEQCLCVYESIVSNNFYMIIPLFKINFDIYRIKNRKRKFIGMDELKEAFDFLRTKDLKDSDFPVCELIDGIDIKIFHTFDNFDIVVKFNFDASTTPDDLNGVLKFLGLLELSSISEKSSSIYISPIEETNSNICGKICIEIGKITIPFFEGDIFVKLTLPPYTLQTKSVLLKEKYSIKQTFFIPLHNRFETLLLEIFRKSHLGLFQQKTIDEKLCQYSILLPDVVNNYFYPQNLIEVDMEIANKNMKNITKATLSYKIANCSNLRSLISKCKNKNIIEDMSLRKSEKEFSVKTLLKRVKKVLILLKEFKEDYKKVFRFEYPLFSLLLMLCSLAYFLFCDTRYWTTHIVFVIFWVIFFYSSLFNIYISPYTFRFIFLYKNPYDFDSNFCSTKEETATGEVRKENYLTEKEKKNNIITTIMAPIKHFKTYKKTYNEVLFKLTNVVSVFEKIKNLFLWTDPLISFYFMIVILSVLLIIYAVQFRYLMLIAVTKKFLSGITFYKQKYRNNLEVASIILHQCQVEWYNENKRKSKSSINSIFPVLNNESNNNQNPGSSINFGITDEKLKILIKENLEKHADILIKPDFLEIATSVAEIQEEVAKCKEILNLKKESSLFHLTRNNKNIYRPPMEPEEVFIYFVQNVKSDYYISRHRVNPDIRNQETQGENTTANESYFDKFTEGNQK